MREFVREELKTHIKVATQMQDSMIESILQTAKICLECLKNGGKILVCGNGGSAADAQHFAAELVGRYKKNRIALKAIALTTDTSILSAVGNDFGFECVFSRQIEALCESNDVLFAISTSGNSINIIKAINAAQSIGAKVIGLSGRDGGAMRDICDMNLIIPSDDTARIQEMHLFIEHTICDIIERAFV